MRPIKLTMKAFGPYRDVETIDFGQLEGRNLFLVTGPTVRGRPRSLTESAMRFTVRRAATLGQERISEASLRRMMC